MDQPKNSIHPQDGNQVSIAENHGTINIHNHSKTNEDIDRIVNRLDNFFMQVEKRVADSIKKEAESKKRKK